MPRFEQLWKAVFNNRNLFNYLLGFLDYPSLIQLKRSSKALRDCVHEDKIYQSLDSSLHALIPVKKLRDLAEARHDLSEVHRLLETFFSNEAFHQETFSQTNVQPISNLLHQFSALVEVAKEKPYWKNKKEGIGILFHVLRRSLANPVLKPWLTSFFFSGVISIGLIKGELIYSNEIFYDLEICNALCFFMGIYDATCYISVISGRELFFNSTLILSAVLFMISALNIFGYYGFEFSRDFRNDFNDLTFTHQAVNARLNTIFTDGRTIENIQRKLTAILLISWKFENDYKKVLSQYAARIELVPVYSNGKAYQEITLLLNNKVGTCHRLSIEFRFQKEEIIKLKAALKSGNLDTFLAEEENANIKEILDNYKNFETYDLFLTLALSSKSVLQVDYYKSSDKKGSPWGTFRNEDRQVTHTLHSYSLHQQKTAREEKLKITLDPATKSRDVEMTLEESLVEEAPLNAYR